MNPLEKLATATSTSFSDEASASQLYTDARRLATELGAEAAGRGYDGPSQGDLERIVRNHPWLAKTLTFADGHELPGAIPHLFKPLFRLYAPEPLSRLYDPTSSNDALLPAGEGTPLAAIIEQLQKKAEAAVHLPGKSAQHYHALLDDAYEAFHDPAGRLENSHYKKSLNVPDLEVPPLPLPSLDTPKTDSTEWYRQLISHPVLSRSQEQSLFRALHWEIAAYVRELFSHPLLTEYALKQLVYQSADEIGHYSRIPADQRHSDGLRDRLLDAQEWLGEVKAREHPAMVTDTLLRAFKDVPFSSRFVADTYHALQPIDGELHLLSRHSGGVQQTVDALWRHNLRLVWKIADNYKSPPNFEFLDAIQAGNLGLLRAIDKFDLGREGRFSTYAIHWIKNLIKREKANTEDTIRLPVQMRTKVNRMNKLDNNYWQLQGRLPSPEEYAKKLKISPATVESLLLWRQGMVSLDNPIDPENDAPLWEFMRDPRSLNPEGEVDGSMLKDRIRQALTALSEREQDILCLRFGIHDGLPLTLDKIGKRYNMSRERIRQIEANALKKARGQPDFCALRSQLS
jgi:RNA polymerase sigma factor (sigma-70 family)